MLKPLALTALVSVVASPISIAQQILGSVAQGNMTPVVEDTAGLGREVEWLDDLTGDGVPEWSVSAPFALVGGQKVGRVLIYSGADSGFVREHTGVFSPSFNGEEFGSRVARLGDLDGDGVAEYAISAPKANPAGDQSGRVAVYSGATGAVLYDYFGGGLGAALGESIANVGDADGDGVEDFAIGAPGADGSAARGGKLFLYSGATGSLVYAIEGTTPNAFLGDRISAAGDADADGLQDLVTMAFVGASGWELRLYSGASGALLRTITPPNSYSFLAAELGTIGDLDGDGHDDLLVGTPRDGQAVTSRTGAVTVLSGRTGDVLSEVLGRFPGDNFGRAATPVEDYDGDDVRDFATIGTHNNFLDRTRISVHSSSTGAELAEYLVDLGGGIQGGVPMSHGGDANGDGWDDLLVGSVFWPFPAVDGGRAWVLSGAPSLGTSTTCGVNPSLFAARLNVQGSDVAVDNDVVLSTSQVIRNTFGYYITSMGSQLGVNPGGYLPLCLGGAPIGRYANQVIANGDETFAQMRIDLTAIPGPTGTTSAVTGQTQYFQYWFRIPGRSDFSNAVGITWR